MHCVMILQPLASCSAACCRSLISSRDLCVPFQQVLHLCLHCMKLRPTCCNQQAGASPIIDAVGGLVQRGVLPSLRRLSIGGADLKAGARVPRPDAAPHLETSLLPAGRRPPGQLFWVTDDVLPDLHVALGVREGYDWERCFDENTAYAAYEIDDDAEGE